MKQKLLTIVLSLGALFSIGLATPTLTFAATDPADAVCEGAGAVSGGTCQNTDGTIATVVELGIRVLQLVAGVMAVVFIIFGGIRYITSGGDPSKVSSAKNAIIYACIGVAVVALAEVIVQFVLNRINKVATDTTAFLLLF